ncbi:hypothetical protein ACLX1H_003223 [Fusarium chlamydosporum]
MNTITPMDPANIIDPLDHDQRRRYVKACFESLSKWNEKDWKSLREGMALDLCLVIYQKGYREVGHSFFEYRIDELTWYGIAADKPIVDKYDLNVAWPWAEEVAPSQEDLREGVSGVYFGYRLAKDRVSGKASKSA